MLSHASGFTLTAPCPWNVIPILFHVFLHPSHLISSLSGYGIPGGTFPPQNFESITLKISRLEIQLKSLMPFWLLILCLWPDFFFFFSFLFCLLYDYACSMWSFQVRGWIRTVASSLGHSHSNTTSKPHLRPMPQLEQSQAVNLHLLY